MKKQLIAGVTALAVAGSGAAVVSAAGPQAPTLGFAITKSAIAVQGQPQVKTGYTRLEFDNRRKGEAGVAVVRLKAGVTSEQFGAAVAKIKDPNDVARYGTIVASTFLMGPSSYATTIRLDDADYAVVDLTRKPVVKLAFHAGPEFDGVTAPPAADVRVKLGDYAFSMPKTLKAGKRDIRVENVGKHMHHALVMPLKKGVSERRVLNDLKKGKEPNYAIGGPPSALVEMVSPQTTNDVEVNLKKGKYLFVCFLQNTPTSKPHAMLGMRKIVRVR